MINSSNLLLVLSIIFGIHQSYGQVIIGSVKNSKNQTISNANVYFPNSLVGTYTDSLGNYTISRLNETVIQFSHLNYKSVVYSFTSKELKNDTIRIDVMMDFDSIMLDEVTISSNSMNDLYREITLKALENLCSKLTTDSMLTYELIHYVKNNAGYTNYFKGLLEIQGIGYKMESRNAKNYMYLLKNFRPQLITVKERRINTITNCGKFCAIVNNKQGLGVFVPVVFNWFGLPWRIITKVNSKDHLFISMQDDLDDFYHIKIISKKKERDHQVIMVIDKETLDFVNIYFTVEETLNKYWKNNITSMVKKGIFPTLLKQKERVWNMKCDFEKEENKLYLKEITIEHSLTYDKNYVEGKNLNKTQFAKWSLQKNAHKETNNGILIKSFEDLYYEK